MRGRALLEDMEHISEEFIEEAMDCDAGCIDERPWHVGWRRWGAAAACAAVFCLSFVCFQLSGRRDSGPERIEQAEHIAQIQDADREDTETAADTDVPAGAGLAAPKGETAGLGTTDSTLDTGSDAEDLSEAKRGLTEVCTIIDVFPPKQMEKDAVAQEEALRTESCDAAPKKGQRILHSDLEAAMAYYGSTDESPVAFQVVIEVFGDRADDLVPYGELCLTDDGRDLLETEYLRLQQEGYQVSLSEDHQLTAVMTADELDSFQPLPEYGYVIRFGGSSDSPAR